MSEVKNWKDWLARKEISARIAKSEREGVIAVRQEETAGLGCLLSDVNCMQRSSCLPSWCEYLLGESEKK